MSLDITLRYPKKVRDQLIWLKRQTGLPHYHTLCRWAFCLSITDPRPIRTNEKQDSEDRPSATELFELPWDRFGQADSDLLADLLCKRVVADGREPTKENLQRTAQLHIQRGVSRMMARKRVRSIGDLVHMALDGAVLTDADN